MCIPIVFLLWVFFMLVTTVIINKETIFSFLVYSNLKITVVSIYIFHMDKKGIS